MERVTEDYSKDHSLGGGPDGDIGMFETWLAWDLKLEGECTYKTALPSPGISLSLPSFRVQFLAVVGERHREEVMLGMDFEKLMIFNRRN